MYSTDSLLQVPSFKLTLLQWKVAFGYCHELRPTQLSPFLECLHSRIWFNIDISLTDIKLIAMTFALLTIRMVFSYVFEHKITFPIKLLKLFFTEIQIAHMNMSTFLLLGCINGKKRHKQCFLRCKLLSTSPISSSILQNMHLSG